MDCTAAHLWQPKFASYGLGLRDSSRRICLRGPAGEWFADNSLFRFKWIYDSCYGYAIKSKGEYDTSSVLMYDFYLIVSGSELYQEKLVEALAKHLKASLLVLDSTVLSPHV